MHQYIGASPACWAIYGEVLAKEYGNLHYRRVHRLTVDAYAAQHPGTPSPQSIQSVTVHLLSLHLVFERGFDFQQATGAIQLAISFKQYFRWLNPPDSPGEMTIVHLHKARNPTEHGERAEQWARAVWNAWAIHHEVIRQLASQLYTC